MSRCEDCQELKSAYQAAVTGLRIANEQFRRAKAGIGGRSRGATESSCQPDEADCRGSVEEVTSSPAHGQFPTRSVSPVGPVRRTSASRIFSCGLPPLSATLTVSETKAVPCTPLHPSSKKIVAALREMMSQIGFISLVTPYASTDCSRHRRRCSSIQATGNMECCVGTSRAPIRNGRQRAEEEGLAIFAGTEWIRLSAVVCRKARARTRGADVELCRDACLRPGALQRRSRPAAETS